MVLKAQISRILNTKPKSYKHLMAAMKTFSYSTISIIWKVSFGESIAEATGLVSSIDLALEGQSAAASSDSARNKKGWKLGVGITKMENSIEGGWHWSVSFIISILELKNVNAIVFDLTSCEIVAEFGLNLGSQYLRAL